MKTLCTYLLLTICFLNSSSAQTSLLKIWDKTYGGIDDETMTSFKMTSDGGFLLAGFTRSDSSSDITQATRGGYDFWVVKTDSLNQKRWIKDLAELSRIDYFLSMKQQMEDTSSADLLHPTVAETLHNLPGGIWIIGSSG